VIEKNTGMMRGKARALIQIYGVIVNSEVKWAQVKHIEWTKLRAIARVLNKENADHWIGIVEALQGGNQRAGKEASDGVRRGGS
jgi:hypothetical protein